MRYIYRRFPRPTFITSMLVSFGLVTGSWCIAQEKKDWPSQDMDRPVPPVVTPGTANSAPSDAIVLFNGTDLSQWVGQDGGPAKWKVENGYMEVVAKTGAIRTKQAFGDCQLHVEWASPTTSKGEGQA